MAKNEPETLAQYLKRNMDEKGLSVKDVQRMSGEDIKVSYINDILSGRSTNPSVKKLKALARGAGVDEDEIFDVARGKQPAKKSERAGLDHWQMIQFLKLDEWILRNPDLLELLQKIAKMPQEDQKRIIKSMRESFEKSRRS